MRRDHLKQLILHSFTHRTAPATSPYSPTTRYSALLSSSDRLLFAHPDPATRAPPTTPFSRRSSTSTLRANDQIAMNKPQRLSTPNAHVSTPGRSPSAPIPNQTTAPKLLRCTHCTRHLQSHEFPACLPTTRCRHGNTTCVYCLHNSVYNAYARGKWGEVTCLICGEGMSEGQKRRLVLLWEEEGGGG